MLIIIVYMTMHPLIYLTEVFLLEGILHTDLDDSLIFRIINKYPKESFFIISNSIIQNEYLRTTHLMPYVLVCLGLTRNMKALPILYSFINQDDFNQKPLYALAVYIALYLITENEDYLEVTKELVFKVGCNNDKIFHKFLRLACFASDKLRMTIIEAVDENLNSWMKNIPKSIVMNFIVFLYEQKPEDYFNLMIKYLDQVDINIKQKIIYKICEKGGHNEMSFIKEHLLKEDDINCIEYMFKSIGRHGSEEEYLWLNKLYASLQEKDKKEILASMGEILYRLLRQENILEKSNKYKTYFNEWKSAVISSELLDAYLIDVIVLYEDDELKKKILSIPDLNEPRLTELALKAIVNHREDDLIVEYIDRIFSKKLLNWTEIHRFGIEIGEKYIKEIIKHSFYRNTEEFLKELFAIFEDWTSIDIEYIANLILWCDGEMLESIIRLIKKFIEHDGIIHDYSLLEIILASLVFKDSDESIRLAKYLINACRIDGLFFEESLFCLFLNESEHSLNLFFDEIFKVEEIEIDKTIMLLNTLNTDIVLKAIVNKLINTHSTKEINMIFALAEGIWYNYDEVILNYMHDHLVPQERIGHIINDLLKYQASRKNIISY